MCGAVGSFAFLHTTAKYLGRQVDVLQVVWARYTFAFLLTLVVSNPLSRPGLLRTARPIFQVGRATLLLGSTFLNFFALKYLRLDQVLAIAFSTPFFVAALSGRSSTNGWACAAGPRSESGLSEFWWSQGRDSHCPSGCISGPHGGSELCGLCAVHPHSRPHRFK